VERATQIQIVMSDGREIDAELVGADPLTDVAVVKIDGKETFFPKKEFELLAFLASNRGKVFSREALLRRIWGESVYVIDRTVDVHVSKVREKLGKHGARIETVKGVGYRFSENG
jgi:two-component system alkaline phosphatase synthesis response regulator PhoP